MDWAVIAYNILRTELKEESVDGCYLYHIDRAYLLPSNLACKDFNCPSYLSRLLSLSC
jgi:hypothetical protein